METFKLQQSLDNVQSELKLERVSSSPKHSKIKSFQDLLIKLGYDLSYVKVAEELIKIKSVDIVF